MCTTGRGCLAEQIQRLRQQLQGLNVLAQLLGCVQAVAYPQCDTVPLPRRQGSHTTAAYSSREDLQVTLHKHSTQQRSQQKQRQQQRRCLKLQTLVFAPPLPDSESVPCVDWRSESSP